MKEKILDAMQRSIESGSCSGANVLVIKDGEEQVYCDYGYRNLANKTPMSRASNEPGYHISSVFPE